MDRTEHLLSCLAEECCETGQRIMKALRFGLTEVQRDQPHDNRERIVQEFRDILAVAVILGDEGVLPVLSEVMPTHEQVATKRERIERYMHIGRATGSLDDPHDGVPTGVWWSEEFQNFFGGPEARGMGREFHERWHSRRSDFPRSRADVVGGELRELRDAADSALMDEMEASLEVETFPELEGHALPGELAEIELWELRRAAGHDVPGDGVGAACNQAREVLRARALIDSGGDITRQGRWALREYLSEQARQQLGDATLGDLTDRERGQ